MYKKVKFYEIILVKPGTDMAFCYKVYKKEDIKEYIEWAILKGQDIKSIKGYTSDNK